MRRLPLALALAIACQPLSAPDALAAPPAGAKASQRTTWLVWFEEAPLASFRGIERSGAGRLAGLKATSPEVTGVRRLDVNSTASRAYRAALTDLRTERLREGTRRIGRALEPVFTYENTANGVALELTQDEARALASVPGVVKVEPDFVRWPVTDAGPQWIRADAIWSAPTASGGNRGEGIVVGIIDTGINSKHPAFDDSGTGFSITNPRAVKYGKCIEASPPATLRCNNKLIGVYDFTTGADDDETNDGNDVAGHGTHVSATAAGVPLRRNFSDGIHDLSGVAPRANLMSYKACEEEAGCKGSWLLAAINQAVADGVDVINYSLGGSAYDPWADATSGSDMLNMLAAREAGVVVVAAVGNDGPDPGTANAPGTAPWVISVAAVSHDRGEVNTLTLSGGDTAPPGGGVVKGASATMMSSGTRPIVYAGNHGSALCAAGNDVDALPPSTSTMPPSWSANTFNGQIVVCDRGTYARVVKGLNVKNAGGGGMVLVNQPAEGEGVVPDAHQLAATHLGYANGAALKQWLSSGSGHQASIGASSLGRLPAYGDILADFSGRGPVEGNWLKPNLAAPGVNILAAASGSTNSFAYMSGTSMATPHVTGAVALLRKAHPGWGPAEVESALQTTARPSVRLPDAATPAGVLDQGAGTIDLAKATKAALMFPVTTNQFCRAGRTANIVFPMGHYCRNQSGDPIAQANLNLPALVNASCFDASTFRSQCTFARSVKDMVGGGTWRVDATGVPGITANVSEFTLAANASQDITFTFAPAQGQYAYNEWVQGYVLLKDVAGVKPEVSIPVAIKVSPGTVPEVIGIGGEADIGAPLPPPMIGIQDGGWHTVSLEDLVALPDLRLAGTDLVRPVIAAPSVPQDSTSDDPFDGLIENKTVFWLTAPAAGEYRLRADAFSSTATDVDLFTGTPGASSSPNEDDELCRSVSPTDEESCDTTVTATTGQRFWVVVQNWDASAAGTDAINLSTALVPLAPGNGTLFAAGPGSTAAGEPFDLRLAWDDATFAPGEFRWGHLLIGSGAGDERRADVGKVLVKIRRSGTHMGPNIARALAPGDANTLHFRLGPNQTHERLYIDVPPGAIAMDVQLRGASGNTDLYLSHIATPNGPLVSAAPSIAQAVAKSESAGSNEDITISGTALTSGRWYVTPVNKTAASADLALTVQIAYGSNRPVTKMGPWVDPAVVQGSSGLYLHSGESVWVNIFHTFLEDGSPTWYQAVEQRPENSSRHWNFTFNRYTWNGSNQIESGVGRGQLVLTGATSAVFNWTLFGQSGSTRLVNADTGACSGISGTRVDGVWIGPPPNYSIARVAGVETHTAYAYDGLGEPRWLRASYQGTLTANQSRDLVVQQLNSGPCPTCTWRVATAHDVGALKRHFGNAENGQFALDVSYVEPLSGEWSVDAQVFRITDPIPCTQ